MGAGASAKSAKAKAAPPPSGGVSFLVSPLSSLEGMPNEMNMVIDDEALLLRQCKAPFTALKTFPYHQIMCWGHTARSFQFRCFSQVPAPSTDLTTIVVSTTEGPQIETVLMKAVTDLMAAMQAKGVSDEEFANLQKVLAEDAEKALETLKMMALSRRFDVKQAVDVVRSIAELSPFDKMEAAVILHGSMINKSSFGIILLNEFDETDRDNLCHRLKVRLTDAGEVEPIGRGGK